MSAGHVAAAMLRPVQEAPPRAAGVVTAPGAPKSLLTADAAERDSATEFASGTVVNQVKTYEVVERLGEGGMGKIYKGYDPVMDRYVALKVLKLDVPEVERRRFYREARIAANFGHPNLARVLDVGSTEDKSLQWMAMEYLRGRDLAEVIEKRRAVHFRLLVDIFTQILDALDYVHVRRIAHCDVKPENIFITRDLYNRRLVIVKLIDFGICRNLDPPLELQKTLSGDPRYMPPEQAVLNGPLDERADLYALGVTFFEVLTNRHPFEHLFDRPVAEILEAHRTLGVPSPSKYLPVELPRRFMQRVDGFVARACHANPERRFTSASEMKEALGALLDKDSEGHTFGTRTGPG